MESLASIHGSTAVNAENDKWGEFFRSPGFIVIAAAVSVLVTGALMYSSLEAKIETLRVEAKSDLQISGQRIDSRFDKVDSRFDKIDGHFDKVDDKFEALMEKIDSNAKETREAIRDSQQKPPKG